MHGISDSILQDNYTLDMVNLLKRKLTELGVLPHEAGPDDIEQIITFEFFNYSDIGHAEEERVLKAYNKERNKLYNILDQLIERAGFDQIRRQLITSISDVLVYESEFWRNQIRQRLLDFINRYVNTGDAVSVVSHSLGSVVAFDTIYYNSRHNEQWKAANFKPANLFTFGSPIALFSLEMDSEGGEQKPRYIPSDATPTHLDPTNTNPDLQPVRDDGVWFNFLDAQDLIAYPLEILFEGKFKLKDILVQTGTNPLKAHLMYWDNHEVAQNIAERLKMDYKRINKS